MRLAPDIQQAVNINGQWTVTFKTTPQARAISRIVISGGPQVTVNVYIDEILVDTTPNGNVNSAEYYQPLDLPAGSICKLTWASASGAAPIGTLFTKEAL